MKRIGTMWLVCLLGAPLLPAPPAVAAAFTFPGPAPCDTTLQACIDGVPRRSVIRIKSKVELRSDLTIRKSLTLTTKGPGKSLIDGEGPLRTISVAGRADKRVEVVINDLRLTDLGFEVVFDKGSRHSFSVLNSRIVGKTDLQNGHYIFSLLPNVSSSFVLKNNEVVGEGTGLEIESEGSPTARLLVQGNIFKATQADNSEGAVLVDNNGGKINSKVYSNVFHGGWSGCNCGFASVVGLRSEPGTESNWTVTGNTIDGNGSEGDGIAPSVDDDTTLGSSNIFDNIVVGTETPLDVDDSSVNHDVNIGYNNFFDNDNPPQYGGNPSGTVFTHDPEFVNSSGGNYRLSSSSDLINVGSHLVPGGIPPTDADGQTRVEEAAMDVGAYEFGSLTGCTIAGTNSPNELTGTDARDVICGLLGDDEIFGEDGGDVIRGAGGHDQIHGEAGRDKLFGGPGPDELFAEGGGRDRLDGGRGNDSCAFDPGDQTRSC